LRTREADLAAAGARLLFVGTGLPAMAADFARAHAGPHPVLSDAGRRAFAAAGMRRSVGPYLRLRFWRNVWRAFRAGFRQQRVQGDPWQQGGVLVFDAAGALRLAQVDEAAGDLLDLDAVLKAAGGC
jgi:hypothetical protein